MRSLRSTSAISRPDGSAQDAGRAAENARMAMEAERNEAEAGL